MSKKTPSQQKYPWNIQRSTCLWFGFCSFIFVCSRGLLELKMPVVSKNPIPWTWIGCPVNLDMCGQLSMFQHGFENHRKPWPTHWVPNGGKDWGRIWMWFCLQINLVYLPFFPFFSFVCFFHLSRSERIEIRTFSHLRPKGVGCFVSCKDFEEFSPLKFNDSISWNSLASAPPLGIQRVFGKGRLSKRLYRKYRRSPRVVSFSWKFVQMLVVSNIFFK